MSTNFNLSDDITATDQGQAAFAYSGDDVTIVNRATLSTTGPMGQGIRVFGDGANITNLGTVRGAGSPSTAILVFGDDYSIDNHGLVESTGAPSRGITAFGDGGVVRNHGFVQSLADNVRAVILIGDENRVDNHGSILTTGSGGISLLALGNDNHMVNHGTVTALGSASIAAGLTGIGSELVNYGLIENHGAVVNNVSPSAVILNGTDLDFVNHGTVLATSGIAVSLGGGDNLVVNRGVIDGGQAIVSAGPAGRADTVLNYGDLVGDVLLGGGDDLYLAGQGGSLDGLLFLGSGDDRVVVRRNGGDLVIADFEEGTEGGDVLDLSAFAMKSFADVLAVATQQGDDVLLQLGRDTTVLLQDVFIGDLHSDDFAFGAAAAASIPMA